MKVKKAYLNKFDVIRGECTAVVRVMQTVDSRFFIDDDNPRYLIPLRAFSEDNEEAIDLLIEDMDGDTFDITLLYPLLLTGTLWLDKVNTFLDLPIKGEKVLATFDYSGVDELVCTGLVTLGKVIPKKYKIK